MLGWKSVLKRIIQSYFIPPDAAGVVLRACDYCVSFVVKRTREYFVFVTIEYLELVAILGGPNSAGFVATRRDDFVSLRIERNFTDFVFVPL